MDPIVTDLTFICGFSLTLGCLFIRTFLELLATWGEDQTMARNRRIRNLQP